MSNALFDKIIKVIVDHHCETTGQQLVEKRIKIGTPNNALMVTENRESIIASLCASVASVYAEEHNLEFTGATPTE